MDQTGNRIYFKGLDTLRFFAFFLVFWMHGFGNLFLKIASPYCEGSWILKNALVQIVRLGTEGVHIFFVLSGFLITYLMIQEENSTGKINIPFFYLRRILRIWPLYYFMMIVGIFILPQLSDAFIFKGNIFKNLFFLNNFDTTELNVGIAWSVAIEEQFYLVWPVIFTLIKNKKGLLVFSSAIFVFSSVFILCTTHEYNHYHTFGNLNYLMTGCIGAIVFTQHRQAYLFSLLEQTRYLVIIILTGLLVYMLAGAYTLSLEIALFILPLVYLFVIFHLILKQREKSLGFSLLGKYTYGMYLYHPTILIACKVLFDVLHWNYLEVTAIGIGLGLLGLIITVIVSMVSYELVEKRLLKLKDHFSFVKTRI
jgi:peptidoglycan/LPS O-acetylase OafA/YrhL